MRAFGLLIILQPSLWAVPIPEPSLWDRIWNLNVAIGENAKAEGLFAFAWGENSCAIGPCSFAMGKSAKAVGPNSYAVGHHAEAVGQSTAALGDYTKAVGDGSRAEGPFSEVIGSESVAQGVNAITVGDRSVVQGVNVRLQGDHMHAVGANAEHIDPEIAKAQAATQVALDENVSHQLDQMEKGYLDDHPECSVCLEAIVSSNVLNPGVKTACGHELHKTCMVSWMLTKLHDTTPDCPNCRQQPFEMSTFNQMVRQIDHLPPLE